MSERVVMQPLINIDSGFSGTSDEIEEVTVLELAEFTKNMKIITRNLMNMNQLLNARSNLEPEKCARSVYLQLYSKKDIYVWGYR